MSNSVNSSTLSGRDLPKGTRDVLPDEMRELQLITRSVLDVLDGEGYGEVRSPTLEFEHTAPDEHLAPPSPYRLIDEHGDVLELRSDMTVPIARIAATRYAAVQPPLRFCYLSRSWRRVERGSGDPREFLQAGAELLGAEQPDGCVEILTVLARVLDASGLQQWSIGLGDSQVIPTMLDSINADAEIQSAVIEALVDRDFVRLDRISAELGDGLDLSAVARTRLNGSSIDSLRPGACDDQLAEAGAGLVALVDAFPDDLRDRTVIDLGLVPQIGYYDGCVFEVYDPSFGRPKGSGGRYDRLLEWAGRPMTGVGFGLDVELVHAAVAGEQRGERGLGEVEQ